MAVVEGVADAVVVVVLGTVVVVVEGVADVVVVVVGLPLLLPLLGLSPEHVSATSFWRPIRRTRFLARRNHALVRRDTGVAVPLGGRRVLSSCVAWRVMIQRTCTCRKGRMGRVRVEGGVKGRERSE